MSRPWQSAQANDRTTQAWCETAIGELLSKQGQYAERHSWLERAQADFEAVNDRAGVAQILHTRARCRRQGDFEVGTAAYEESLSIRQELDDQANIASLFNNMAS